MRIVRQLTQWELTGGERFLKTMKSMYPYHDGFVIIYDIKDRSTFKGVELILKGVREHGQEGAPVLLVGNKSDCAEERTVSFEEGRVSPLLTQAFAEQHGVSFLECSAKEDLNVAGIFESIAGEVIEQAVDGETIGTAMRRKLSLAKKEK